MIFYIFYIDYYVFFVTFAGNFSDMLIKRVLLEVANYLKLMRKTFRKPDNWSMFGQQIPREVIKLGLDSIGIVILISVFTGVILTVQTILNTSNPLLPRYTTGFVLRDTFLLEFSSTIMCLLLAGKVGSNIASELGSMRVSEQIDALDIMGVNSANYLILPKIIALVISMPILVTFSSAFGIIGGVVVARFSSLITMFDFIQGLQYAFHPYYFTQAVIKSLFFGFIIASVSSYYGYRVNGGALAVGRASTMAVVNSSVIVLLSNIILTDLLLT